MRNLLVAIAALTLAACVGTSPRPSPSTRPASPTPTPAPAAMTDGAFRLDIALARLDWTADEVISGMASLSYAGASPTVVYGSGSGMITFAFDEVGGNRHVAPIWTTDCAPHRVGAADPVRVSLSKSGAEDAAAPDADFLRSFLADPQQIRLPEGIWDITAVARFYPSVEPCSGPEVTLRASQRIAVR